MAKIKDSVVISDELLNRIIRRLDKCGCENLSSELENSYKPLEPIVKDTLIYCSFDEEEFINTYLNDKEI